MTECEFCAIVQGEFESEELYQDDTLLAVLHLKPASPGHILLFTKEHFPILEQVPDSIIGHLFQVANKLSIAAFESLGVQGTNIIAENGTAAGQTISHFSMHIIPRRENDGLGLQWQPRKITSDELDTAFLKIKEKTSNLHPSTFEKEKQRVVVAPPDVATKEKSPVKQQENYRFRQLRRIP